jgi:hypothetical protein
LYWVSGIAAPEGVSRVSGSSKSALSWPGWFKAANVFSTVEILVSSEVDATGSLRFAVAVLLVNCGGIALLFWVDLTANLGFLRTGWRMAQDLPGEKGLLSIEDERALL